MRQILNRIAGVVAVISAFSIFPNTLLDHSSAAAQQKERPQQQKPAQPSRQDDGPLADDDVVKLGTDLVLLNVTVVDASNNPVMDLKQADFEVLEDKVAQKIDFFTREQVPVSVVLTIDTSGSMRPKLDTVIKAATNLVKDSKPNDELAVIEFKDQPELLEEFTTNVTDVVDTLQGLIASRQTAMLDALYLAADYASKEGRNRRKAVVLVSDGLDEDSYYKFEEVVEHLRETDVQVYLVGFTNDLEKSGGWVFSKSPKEKAEKLLNRIANETGGRAFYPKELADVHTIAQQISTDLRTQYLIGYYPTNSKKDGTFRALKVNINGGNRRLVARTRNGYNAPREGEQRNASRQPSSKQP
jgi:Ca-activated chloride channel family protein